MPEARLRRSLLMTPGNRPERLAKATTLGADALIFDLEDAVPPPFKPDARRRVADALAKLDFQGAERIVRVNAPDTEEVLRDLAALPLDLIDTIMVPKVERPEALIALDDALAAAEKRCGRSDHVELIVTLETSRGILNALPIAEASPRATALFFGSGDYLADTGGRPTATALHVPRSLVVMAASAAGLQAIDAAYFAAVKDPVATKGDALVARDLGYVGKVVFHPSQIAPVHEVFTPDAAAVDRARRIVAAQRAAEMRGQGTVFFEGTFIAIDILLMAERTLAIARRAGIDTAKESVDGQS